MPVPRDVDGALRVAGDLPLTLPMRLVRALNSMYARGYHHLHQHNRCPIPVSGPALIAANHTAGLDPAIVQAACPRRIHWLMTRRFYDRPSMNWFFRWSGMIPIQTEGRDSAAWRKAIEHLRLGRVVGVFPEGRIERRGAMMPFQVGVALLAIRGGASIYPVYLDGLQRDTPMLQTYLLPQYPSLAWGQPLASARLDPSRQRLREATEALQVRMRQLQALFPAPRRRGQSLLALHGSAGHKGESAS